mmetsp:Transcript_137572/g.439598  ORF Transcript_137572/g.439598 Transcript_137572/m.439598 type:complete len:664 (+) Transcript_137572:40-2031(+)
MGASVASCNSCQSPSCESAGRSCRGVGAESSGTKEWSPSNDLLSKDESILHHRVLPTFFGRPAEGEQAVESAASSGPALIRMRIIMVSDVYLLDNLPCLKTLVAAESQGFPPENIVTALPGDFLAPSLLSSLDAGFGMIKALNHIPINLVCFGNHDGNDISYPKLVHRIEEFKGTWLNSNIPDFDPDLPHSYSRELTAEDGTKAVRKVGFLGFCMGGGKWQSMYREDAFGGAHRTIIPVLESVHDAVDLLRRSHPDIEEVIPLTHQDMAEDIEMAKLGIFPVILGGHDHEQMMETHGDIPCKIVKPGQDAVHAGVIDLEWYSLEPKARPTVKVSFRACKDYEPDQELSDVCEKATRPVRELEQATLYELPRGAVLSSVNSRFGDVSMAQMLATCVKECLRCDAAIINSGTIRGNKEYDDSISYGDLKKECPFVSAVVVVSMPFSVLRDGVKRSRKPWWDVEAGAAPKECASALQVDEGMIIRDHAPMTIRGEEPDDDDELYAVACDTYVLRKNEVFKEYCKNFPERVPPSDCGRPLLPILVEHFCSRMWVQLIDDAGQQVMTTESVVNFKRAAAMTAMGTCGAKETDVGRFLRGVRKIFELLDKDKDGEINITDLQEAVQNILGDKLSSNVVVEQMIQMVDENNDQTLSEEELLTAVRKLAPR